MIGNEGTAPIPVDLGLSDQDKAKIALGNADSYYASAEPRDLRGSATSPSRTKP